MVMNLSEANRYTYQWLWLMPWASVADLALVMNSLARFDLPGATVNAINTALNRHPEWVARYQVGRKGDAVNRYVMLPQGVAELSRAFGWPVRWWHTADGQEHLFHQLEFLELCYKVLPDLWRSNLIGYDYSEEDLDRTLDKAAEERARTALFRLEWYRGERVRLVASYLRLWSGEGVHVPVTYYGSYRRPRDVRSWKAAVERVLKGGEPWPDSGEAEEGRVPQGEAPEDGGPAQGAGEGSPRRFPLLVVAGNEALGVKARDTEHWDDGFSLGIIDLKENIVNVMDRDVLLWERFVLPDGPGTDLGDPRQVEHLVTGSYWRVLSSRQQWAVFRWIHDFEGSSVEQIAEGCDLNESRVREIIDGWERGEGDSRQNFPGLSGLGLVMQDGDGLYLTEHGCSAISHAEGCHPKRVRGRVEKLLTDPEFRRERSVHNWEAAEAAVILKREGLASWSGDHVTFNYGHLETPTQIRPDLLVKVPVSGLAFVHRYIGLLSPEFIQRLEEDRDFAILVVLEVERRAGHYVPPERKVRPYRLLYEQEIDRPVNFITETGNAAEKILESASRELSVLATTWERLRNEGIRDCWMRLGPGGLFPDDSIFTHGAGIDYFAAQSPNQDWMLFRDRKFQVVAPEPPPEPH